MYLEGTTDLEILKEFARILGHRALQLLESSFVEVFGNETGHVPDHFSGLKEAVPRLRAFALSDRTERQLQHPEGLVWHAWERREIENYFCQKEVLLAFAEAEFPEASPDGPGLFSYSGRTKSRGAMENAIRKTEEALHSLDKDSPWGSDLKVSDEFLKPLFQNYSKEMGEAPLRKGSFHELVSFVPADGIDHEVRVVLDKIERLLRPTDA